MGLLGIVLIWPLLVLVIGLGFISASGWAGILILPAFILLFFFLFGMRYQFAEASVPGSPVSTKEDLDHMRRSIVAFSIALFLPIFVKYLLTLAGDNLPAMILALVFGFAVLIWGMFMKGNKVLMYANCIGGAFVIIYLYFQLWTLGQLAQVVATAFGLVVAVVISIVKFRERLTS